MSQSSTTEPAVVASDEPREAATRCDSALAGYHWVLLIGSTAAIGLSFVLSLAGNNGVSIAGLRLPETCVLHGVAGIDCPGCGLTRSFVALAHGDWWSAWQFNPAGPLLFVVLAAQIPFRMIQLWRMRVGAEPLDSPWLWLPLWGILGVVVVQWLARLAGWLTLPAV